MLEFIRHALGFCGDHWHPSLMTALMGGIGIVPAVHYLRLKFGGLTNTKD